MDMVIECRILFTNYAFCSELSQPRNFLTEAEVVRFLQAAKSGRHGIRDQLMMLLLYRHGLRETELFRLAVSALDLETARIWIDRWKGSLSTHHPIDGEEVQAIRRFLRVRDSRLPWLFVTERGGQFTRQGIHLLPGPAYRRARRSWQNPSAHAPPYLRVRVGEQGT
jgi:type 1 fimbriae regulatory protein FimB